MIAGDEAAMSRDRRLPIGAEAFGSEGVHFRVWAPKRKRVEVVLEGGGSPERDCDIVSASTISLTPIQTPHRDSNRTGRTGRRR
jgi:hypothetical protein